MRKAALTSSPVAGRESLAVRSVIDPTGTGTRSERPVSFPSSSGMIRPIVRSRTRTTWGSWTGPRHGRARRSPVRSVVEALVAGVGVDRRQSVRTQCFRRPRPTRSRRSTPTPATSASTTLRTATSAAVCRRIDHRPHGQALTAGDRRRGQRSLPQGLRAADPRGWLSALPRLLGSSPSQPTSSARTPARCVRRTPHPGHQRWSKVFAWYNRLIELFSAHGDVAV